MKKKLLIVGIFSCCYSLSAFEVGGRLTFALKSGMFSPSSKNINNEIISPINQSIQDFVTQAAAFGFTAESDEFNKIGQGLILGGEVEWFFRPRISVAAGAEYFQNARSAFNEASGTEGAITYELSQKYDVKASVIPLLATVRYHFPLGKYRLYAGAGVGYYMGKLNFKMNYNLKVDSVAAESDTTENEGTGQAVIPHVNAGLDLELLKHVSLTADLRYSFGTIKSFKIKKHTESEMIGKKITYTNAQGDEKPVMWELDGFTLGLMVKIKF